MVLLLGWSVSGTFAAGPDMPCSRLLCVRYEELYQALVFGKSAWNLAGSTRRNTALDAIQLGSVLSDGSVYNGLLAESEWFIRGVHDIIRDYSVSGVGANQTTLEGIGALQDIIQRDMGSFGQTTLDAVQLYRKDSESMTETILATDLLVSSTHVLLVLALYIVVFHRMVSVLMRQVRAWFLHTIALHRA